MRKELRIFVIFLFGWLVFGIANLLGQPQQFLPPLYIDSLALVIAGCVFLVFDKNIKGKWAVFSLTISFAFAFWAENSEEPSTEKLTGILSLIFLLFSVITHSMQFYAHFYKTDRFTTRTWMIFCLLIIALSIFLIASRFQSPTHLLTYTYWLSIPPALLLLRKHNSGSPISSAVYSFWALFSLSALYDLGDYLALYPHFL